METRLTPKESTTFAAVWAVRKISVKRFSTIAALLYTYIILPIEIIPGISGVKESFAFLTG
jgi:uncharacterized membrane protein YkvA (DUF1232 family)